MSKNCPLHEQTKGLFNKELISKMKKGAWLVNTARGAICDADAVKEAVESGHLAGYGGDVWNKSSSFYRAPGLTFKHMSNQLRKTTRGARC